MPRAEAQRALCAAISYAPAGDLLTLARDALAAGASLTERDVHGKDVLSLAVHDDRPHAIGTLLALGADLPEVPAHGIDLLMKAAMLGHTECCSELLHTAGLDPRRTDKEGRSALFFAAQAGSTQSARILLNAGALPNQAARRLSPETLQNIFGLNHQLDGRKVTPLMVATARGDKVMVDVLVSAGAGANDGDCPPLHLAADAHDPDMIQRLLDSGAEVAASLDWETNCPLDTAIKSNAPMNCLRLLAASYLFGEDDPNDQDSPLANAIRAGRHDAVALFLAHGADPGPHATGQASLWRMAAASSEPAEGGGQRRLHLLTTARAGRWSNADPDTDNATLAFDAIVRAHSDIAMIASEGFYPSLLQGLLGRLHANPPVDGWQGTRPSALYAATLYAVAVRADVAEPAPTQRAQQAGLTPDREWMCRTDDISIAQSTWLKTAATALLKANEARLRQAISAEFFEQMTGSCPDSMRLDKYIADRLAASSSLPASVTGLLAAAWFDAARHALTWGNNQLNVEQATRFVVQQMLARAAHLTETRAPELQNPVTALWLSKLRQFTMEAMALRSFADNPLTWLMQHEQRHNLRPVNVKSLAIALGCELGLPPDTCNAIADGWARVISKLAGDGHSFKPDTLWRAAAKGLSPVVADALVTDTRLVLPSQLRALAEHWCVQQTGPLPGRLRVPLVEPVDDTMLRMDSTLASAPSSAPSSGPGSGPGSAAASVSDVTPQASPAAPPASPVMNLTSPDGGTVAPSSPARTAAPAAPPPRPPAERKRTAEPDTGPRKEARRQ